ncbi:MAG: hypothetical protein AAFN04_16260 [Pseudomonadota bacterium]
MGEIIEQAYLAFVGALSFAFFGAVAVYVMHAGLSRWREFETLYLQTEPRKPLARKMAGTLRFSKPGYRWGPLSGDLDANRRHPPVFVGVHRDGLTLSIVPPFKFGCRDLFLPFAKMTVVPAKWDLLSDEYAIRMDGVEGLEILMFSTIMEWAAQRSDVLALMLERAEHVRGLQAA